MSILKRILRNRTCTASRRCSLADIMQNISDEYLIFIHRIPKDAYIKRGPNGEYKGFIAKIRK